MTIDEALDALGISTEECLGREVLTALATAATERGRAEGFTSGAATADAAFCAAIGLRQGEESIADWKARLLAAHGREAAAEVWKEVAGMFRRMGLLAVACDMDNRAAALRGKEGTTGSTGESEGQP